VGEASWTTEEEAAKRWQTEEVVMTNTCRMSWHSPADSAKTGQGARRQEGVRAIAIAIVTLMRMGTRAAMIRGLDHRCSEGSEKGAVFAIRRCGVNLWTILGEIGNAIWKGKKRQTCAVL
jgi:hypothetical protein